MVSRATDMVVRQPLLCLKVQTPAQWGPEEPRPSGNPEPLGAQGPDVVDKGEPDPVARVRTIQKPIYYISEVLHEAKARYLETHKLIYAILIASGKFN